jgi:hypothetical protein
MLRTGDAGRCENAAPPVRPGSCGADCYSHNAPAARSQRAAPTPVLADRARDRSRSPHEIGTQRLWQRARMRCRRAAANRGQISSGSATSGAPTAVQGSASRACANSSAEYDHLFQLDVLGQRR